MPTVIFQIFFHKLQGDILDKYKQDNEWKT